MRRRRERARRSTTPSTNGATATTSVSRNAHPLATRSPKKRLSGVPNAAPTLASIDPISASVARPSSPSRASAIGPGGSPDGTPDSPDSCVVMVIAAISRARKGPCSPAAKGIARSTSCASTDGISARAPVCSAIRADAVLRSARAGDAGRSPARAIRGRPLPPIPSRTTTASAFSAYSDTRAKRAEPAPPKAPASVETNTSVRAGMGAGWLSCGPNPRTSSASAAVPEALFPRKRSGPALSRWATMMIASSDRPGTTATMLRSSTVPRSANVSVQVSVSTRRPYEAIVCSYQRAAPAASGVPGTREGKSVDSRDAMALAEDPSNNGSMGARASVPGLETEKRSASKAGTTTTAATRTSRALTGLSTVPRRGRRLRLRGRAASIAGL